ncbi:RING-type domain-containing protein [Abeliophyllum distichum]|uniref:RING-type domain-containing protein n=1 Tax=Abeliophyllum distichum TaxID=126358 RepID=A0ABD1VZB9_9LAMI
MFHIKLQQSVVLNYIFLIASQLKWAWDYILLQSFFQTRGIELPDYVDDRIGMRYENKNNAECEDSSVECTVCLCRIDEGDEVRELRCQHLYHRVCLDRWHRICPLCRNNLKPLQMAADLHQAKAEVILINFCATRSRDDRCNWWLR